MSKQHYRDSPTADDRKAFARYLAEDEELIIATGLGKTYLRSHFIIGLGWPGFIFLLSGLTLAYILQINPGYGLLVGLVVAGLVSYLVTLIMYHANRYLLTSRRVIIKKGFFAVQVTSALYDKITHIEVIQSFWDKVIYHHGTVIINTAGINKIEIAIKFVDYPMEFKNILERLINREREIYGGGRADPVVTVEGEVVE